MIPFFKKTYNYITKMDNYEINNTTIFKNVWFKCNVKQTYALKTTDDTLKDKITSDLLNDGFKKKGDKYIRIIKKLGLCNNLEKKYKSEHKENYVIFKLNGNSKINLNYGNNYEESYVTAKINNKNTNDIVIDSNLNINRKGKYIISYTLNISKYYNERLYRIVTISDNVRPEITLYGDKEVILNYGDKYEEQGFIAKDNYDGDITNAVEIKGEVNPKKAGTYKITYKVKDSSGNMDKKERIVVVKNENIKVNKESLNIEVKNGITYVNGIILVNKQYHLPKDYDPKVNKTALKALKNMQADAKTLGLDLSLISGYRSYETQERLYNEYVKKDGEALANTYSAKPGESEHQTGLAFDIGSVERSFANTLEAKWIEENAHLYGFIVRYPKDKINITGYIYEPWHVRYLGEEIAKKVKERGLTLEEFLGL